MMIDRERIIAELVTANLAIYANMSHRYLQDAIASLLINGFEGFANLPDAELSSMCKHYGIKLDTVTS
jgi:hypothetical protein